MTDLERWCEEADKPTLVERLQSGELCPRHGQIIDSECVSCALVATRRELQQSRARLSEQETLLAERNRQNAAAFTASGAYQKRCEQGDALLREAQGVISSYAAITRSREKSAEARELGHMIDAHLVDAAMGAKEGK